MRFNWTRFFLVLICFSVVFLCACTPSETGALSELIPVIGGIVAIATATLTAVDPALAVPVTATGTLIQNGLKALQGLVNGYKSNPTDTTLQKVTEGFTDVQNNLAALEAAAKVSDPVTQAKINAGIAGFTSALGLIETSLAGNHPAAVATAAATAQQTP